jgi:voltage-gated potassium channel
MSIRQRTWEIVEAAKPGDKVSLLFDVAVLSLIFLNVLAVIFGSVQFVEERWGTALRVFEAASLIVFSLEYIARLWSCTADRQYAGRGGRVRFALMPMPIIDLAVILPLYLPFLGIDLRSLRILRLLRMLTLAKIGRYYSSFNLIQQVFRTKKEELVLTSAVLGLLLVISSSALFYCENEAQPDTFSSIPATMWWSIATLTTVGYGDMLPVTVIGKFLASIIAILGIGMFALPTGILGAGFVEAIQKQKEIAPICPHCGKALRHDSIHTPDHLFVQQTDSLTADVGKAEAGSEKPG